MLNPGKVGSSSFADRGRLMDFRVNVRSRKSLLDYALLHWRGCSGPAALEAWEALPLLRSGIPSSSQPLLQ